MTAAGGVLGLIPAKGGSTRLARKNIVQLGGKPLLAWAAEAARESGVIDRLIVTPDSVLVIDYKTHHPLDNQRMQQLLHDYRPQLDCYAQAAARLWPDHRIRAGLLFTAAAELRWLDRVQSAISAH